MPLLYLLSILTGSFLLFIVQPMLSKVLLPYVGGAPAVWIACMLFFQLLLLVGYGYASLSSCYLTARRQSQLHLALTLLATVLFLPLSLTLWYSVEEIAPEKWVIITLLGTIGLPYILLSANATLLQRWYYEVKRTSPYYLFSISNAGSLLGLLSYPLLIEWLLPLQGQMAYWSGGFYLLILLLALITFTTQRSQHSQKTQSLGKNLPIKQIGRIVFYGFIPSSLFLSTTLFITTDVASMPLLWVLPLALYLLSFVIVFSRNSQRWINIARAMHLPACALIFLFALYVFSFTGTYTASSKFIAQASLYLLCFFIIAVCVHGKAAESKPTPEYLTSYYFWLSVGGALGGLFNTLSPYLFTDMYEYPLILLLSLTVLPASLYVTAWRHKFKLQNLITIGSLSIIFLTILIVNVKGIGSPILFKDRNFFGLKIVADRQLEYPRHDFRLGNTLQGYQPTLPEYQLSFTSYYQPLDKLLEHAPEHFFKSPFAVVGLGVGILACTAKEGQLVDFFEIDPLVIDIAQNPSLFTYLQDCPATSNVIAGDGRRKLEQQPNDKYTLMVMDAYTSNAIPVHLVTKEAIETYLEKLNNEEGLIAYNVSNRHLDLRGVLANIAQELNQLAYYKYYHENPDEPYDAPSGWILMISPDSPWKAIIEKEGFQLYSDTGDSPLWTDNYSSILKILK